MWQIGHNNCCCHGLRKVAQSAINCQIWSYWLSPGLEWTWIFDQPNTKSLLEVIDWLRRGSIQRNARREERHKERERTKGESKEGISVTRLGNFWKFLVTNFLTKVAQIYRRLFRIFENNNFQVKTAVASFCPTFSKIGLLLISASGHTGRNKRLKGKKRGKEKVAQAPFLMRFYFGKLNLFLSVDQ